MQRVWRKKRYQYLQYFMLPKHLRYEPEPEFSSGRAGAGAGPGAEMIPPHNEDSNGSNNNSNEKVQPSTVVYELLNNSRDTHLCIISRYASFNSIIGICAILNSSPAICTPATTPVSPPPCTIQF